MNPAANLQRRSRPRLRTRITVGLTLGTAAVVLIASLLVWASARSVLFAGVDHGLARRSDEFTTHLWWQDGRLQPRLEHAVPPEF